MPIVRGGKMAMLDFDAAIALIADVAAPLASETVPLEQAHGRVLAQPVVARVAAPAGDSSAMDGIAVIDAATRAGDSLRLVGASYAGEPFAGTIGPGEAVRIFTGALLPAGADRVIMQEHVTFDGERATVGEGYGPGWHVRRMGEDFAVGDTLVPAGARLGPGQVMAAAGADVGEVMVTRRPRVRVLATGSELVAPGSAAGQAALIPESVAPAVAALAAEWGAEVIGRDRLPDDLPTLQRWAAGAVRDADVVVITGGASVGERDFARAMFAEGPFELVFSKVAIKPGKPVWMARSGDTWIVGLPGNPTSALVTARLFLVPLLARLSGRALGEALDWRTMALNADCNRGGDREVFLLARSDAAGLHLPGRQDSGGQAAWARGNALVRTGRCELVAGGEAVAGGWRVPVLQF